jgi:type II secretory pathway component PulK
MRLRRRSPNSQGSALISALFITALAAIIATSLAVRSRLVIHEAQLVERADNTYVSLQTINLWASNQISNFLSQWTQLHGQAPQSLRPMQWAFKKTRVNNQLVSAIILDAQGRFNLNDLLYTANQPRFAALLMTLVPTVTQKTATSIAQAITDWMTAGKLDAVYERANPAYTAPKRQMADVSELRLIDGMSAEIYEKLLPYVIVLPVKALATTDTTDATDATDTPSTDTDASAPQQEQQALQTPININSVSWQVLLSENPQINAEQAQQLVACRLQYGYFTTIDAFNTSCMKPLKISAISGNLMTVSNYYLVESTAYHDDITIHLNSLMVAMLNKQNKLEVSTIWQAFY